MRRLAPRGESLCLYGIGNIVKSDSSKKIDEVISEGTKQYLKENGFRKTGRCFYKSGDIFIYVIDFQSSQYNDPTSAKFTINVNVVFPYFHEKWTNTPLPKNPSKAAAVISRRVGHLMNDNGDSWWEVSSETNAQELGMDIRKILSSSALPFLLEIDSVNKVLELVRNGEKPAFSMYNPDIITAIMHKYNGNKDLARKVLGELRAKNKVKNFTKTIELISEHLECS